ncbi:hypothetical protein NL108_009625 [Boleophthalmus pectinirostris]|nr:hypothetical protein NL108_009625 [Boleophthalmus pectinirostris]
MQPSPLSLMLALSFLSSSLLPLSCIRVIPDKPAFQLYDSVSLRCDDQDSATVWRVKRSTGSMGVLPCLSGWGSAKPGSPCFIKNIYPSDIGTYWCENEEGQRSASVNIIINGNITGPVSDPDPDPATGKNLKKYLKHCNK